MTARRGGTDPLSMPLSGLRLVEASAGTGKTFSLAGLYLRLLLEKRLDVRDILVMTFTRAATQELRARIRDRLAAAARIAADPDSASASAEDRLARDLIRTAADSREKLARQLRDAAARMDEATITTIHGFSQQAVAEHAFDSAVAFDRGEQAEDAELRVEVVADYWRGMVIGRADADSDGFLDFWPTPDRLHVDLRPLLDHPHLNLYGPDAATVSARVGQALADWRRGLPELRATLEALDPEVDLGANSRLRTALQRTGGMGALLDELDAAVSVGRIAPVRDQLELLSSATLPSQLKGKARKQGVAGPLTAPVDCLLSLPRLQRLAGLRAAHDGVDSMLRERKHQRRRYSFNDMIEALHAAVTDARGGPALVEALRRRWPWALVDEFQDTDSLQYAILRAVYRDFPGGGMVMIGDPKQAIYGFRGGDVFAYLQAARDADDRYSLAKNFRSTAEVLRAVETLFTTPPSRPFVIEDIRFQAVEPGRRPQDRVILQSGQPLPALTVWHLPWDGGKPQPKGDAKALLARTTATEIQRLLDRESGGVVRRDGVEERLSAGEICVLVNSNREAAEFQTLLARQGIAAACLHQSSVFASGQAGDMLRVLQAVAAPADPRLVRAALVTDLFGLRLGDLVALAADDAAWQSWLERFQEAHQRWEDDGVLAMLEPLVQQAGPRILGYEDGERRMTNWLHLAERLQAAERECFGIAGLVRWLAEHMDDDTEGTAADEAQLRLESDESLVRIATIHKVKGLQFPVVMLPYAPMMGKGPDNPKKPPYRFHDSAGAAWLDVGCDQDAANAPQAIREHRAEALRVLYVAVTRAEQALYLPWGYVNDAQYSPLAWLLHQADGASDADWPSPKEAAWFSPQTVARRLQDLEARGGDAIRLTRITMDAPAPARLSPPAPPAGAARSDFPAPRPPWQMLSFSALVRGERPAPASDSGIDDETRLQANAPSADPELAGLGGTGFGSAVHDILEAADFSAWPAPDTAPGEQEVGLVRRSLERRGISPPPGRAGDRQLAAVAALVSRCLHTPLPEIGPLAAVPRERRLAEMGFAMRLGGESAGRLIRLLRAHGYEAALPEEHRGRVLRGLMQGFVDLLVEQGGRFWVLDYKTNRLDGERDAYRGTALENAVRRGHYDLQYLIYLVALHRHLRQRLTGYAPERNLGGVQYLFVRGMNGMDDGAGVYMDRPSPELIGRLDALLDGGGPA